MTSEQIRTEAIERVARGLYEVAANLSGMKDPYLAAIRTVRRRPTDPEPEPFPSFEDGKDQWISFATPIVEALGDMLPADVRYAVRNPASGKARFVDYELDECKDFADEYDATVIRQYLGEWVPHE